MRDALVLAAESAKDPISRSEAESLCREVETFSFIVALILA